MTWFKPKPKPVVIKTQVTIDTHPLIHRARRLSTVMDEAFTIPVINYKVGLDPLLGMIPGLGDIISFVLSCYLFWVAYQLNLPRQVFLALGINLALDTLVGAVPVLGDIFDFVWKANKRNLVLLEKAYEQYGDRSAHPDATPVTITVQAETSKTS